MDGAGGKMYALHAQHMLSYEASEKLSQVASEKDTHFVHQMYGLLARFMNHDMLHGFNGEPRNFSEFDEHFVF